MIKTMPCGSVQSESEGLLNEMEMETIKSYREARMGDWRWGMGW